MASKDSQNFYRTISLLMDICSDVLRHQFLDSVTRSGAGSTELFLYNNQSQLNSLQKKRILRPDQMALLAPDPATSLVDLDRWDITFLCTLIKNLCSSNVDASVLSVVDDLRNIRNSVHGHTHLAALSDAEFGTYWADIEKSLRALLKVLGDADFETTILDRIRRLETGPLGIQSTLDLLREWYSQTRTIDVKLDLVSEKLDQLASDVRANPVLEKMKKQTALFLQELGAVPHAPTEPYRLAGQTLNTKGVVVLVAGPGDGKTLSAAHLLTERHSLDRCLSLQEPSQWEYIDTEAVDAVLLDDVFGRHSFSAAKLDRWRPILELIQSAVDSRDLQVIVTSRSSCLAECQTELTRYEMFRHKVTCTSVEMTDSEKCDILKTVLKYYDKDTKLSDAEIASCVRCYEIPFGFPCSCKEFALNTQRQFSSKSFFKLPVSVVHKVVSTLRPQTLVSLLFLFYTKGQCPDVRLRQRRRADCAEDQNILSFLNSCIESGVTDVTLPVVKKQLDLMTGTFIRHEDKMYSFFNQSVYDCVALFHGERYPDEVLEVCTVQFLCSNITVQSDNDSPLHMLNVDKTFFDNLSERLVSEVLQRNTLGLEILDLVKHSAFQDQSFCCALVNWLSEKRQIQEFLCSGTRKYFLVTFIEQSSDSVALIEAFSQELTCGHLWDSPLDHSVKYQENFKSSPAPAKPDPGLSLTIPNQRREDVTKDQNSSDRPEDSSSIDESPVKSENMFENLGDSSGQSDAILGTSHSNLVGTAEKDGSNEVNRDCWKCGVKSRALSVAIDTCHTATANILRDIK